MEGALDYVVVFDLGVGDEASEEFAGVGAGCAFCCVEGVGAVGCGFDCDGHVVGRVKLKIMGWTEIVE